MKKIITVLSFLVLTGLFTSTFASECPGKEKRSELSSICPGEKK